MAKVQDIPDVNPDPTIDNSEVWISLDGELSLFRWTDRNKDKREARNINLILDSIVLVWDPVGNPPRKIPPRWNLWLYGRTKQHGAVKIMMGADQAVISAIRDIQGIGQEEICSLYASAGQECTFVNVYKWDGTQWLQIRESKIEGGLDGAVDRVRLHPAFDSTRSHLRPFAKGEQPTFGSKSNRPSQVAPPPAGAGSSLTQSPVQAGVTGASAKEGELKRTDEMLYGWRPTDWPGDEQKQKPPSERQLEKFDAFCEDYGLLDEDAAKILQGVCDWAKYPPKYHRTFAGYWLANKFLEQASGTALDALIQSTAQDPFADE